MVRDGAECAKNVQMLILSLGVIFAVVYRTSMDTRCDPEGTGCVLEGGGRSLRRREGLSGISCNWICLAWDGINLVGANWIVADWIDWVGWEWIGRYWIGQDWMGLNWIGADVIGSP